MIHEHIKRLCEKSKSIEDCIVECYTYEEAIKFYNEYLSNGKGIKLPKIVCTRGTNDNGKILIGMITVSAYLVCQGHSLCIE